MSLAIAYLWWLAKVALLVAGLLATVGVLLIGYITFSDLVRKPRF